MLLMFLDESGDHSLDKIDPQYPLFVLAGVILDEEYANTTLGERLRVFKRDLFGTDDIVLHTADITRNRGGFERMKEPEFRQRFYERLNSLIESLEFKVVACAIRKDEHLEKYGLSAINPYLLSLHVLVERLVFELNAKRTEGTIIAESRGGTLDNELDLAFLNLKIQGTRYIQASEIRRKVRGLVFQEKHRNVAGLQLADLVATPIGRFVVGKEIKEDFRIVEQKFRTFQGKYHGAGLVILPK